MSENELTTEYKIIADAAFETLNQLNAAFETTGRSVKLSKTRLKELATTLDTVVDGLNDSTGAAAAFANGMKEIVASKTTVGGAINTLGEQLAKVEARINKGTNAFTAFSNRMKSFRGEETAKALEKVTRAQEAETAALQATNNELIRQDRLRLLKGQKPLHPELKFSDLQEQEALLEGLRNREDQAAEKQHTRERTRNAEDTDNYERELLKREAIKREMIAQGEREARTFDSFNSSDQQRTKEASTSFEALNREAQKHNDEIRALNLRALKQGLQDGERNHKEELATNAAVNDSRPY